MKTGTLIGPEDRDHRQQLGVRHVLWLLGHQVVAILRGLSFTSALELSAGQVGGALSGFSKRHLCRLFAVDRGQSLLHRFEPVNLNRWRARDAVLERDVAPHGKHAWFAGIANVESFHRVGPVKRFGPFVADRADRPEAGIGESSCYEFGRPGATDGDWFACACWGDSFVTWAGSSSF